MSTRKTLIVKMMFGLLVLALVASTWTPAYAAKYRVHKQTISLGNQGVKILTRGQLAARIEINKVEAPATPTNGSKQHFGLVIKFLDAEKRTVKPDAEVFVFFVLSRQERSRWNNGNRLTIWFRGGRGGGSWSKCPTFFFNGGENGMLACQVKNNGTYVLGYTARYERLRQPPE